MALSLHRKITVIVLALYWPAFFVSAHVPIPRVVREAHVSDKGLHFLAYLVLTFLLWFGINGDKKVNWRSASVWWILLAAVGYGVIDELLQGFVTGRSCDVRDFVVDVAGTLSGLILFSVFTFWPCGLLVAAIFIFGITNVARANLAAVFPVASALFYLLAYAIFTSFWLQCMAHCMPGLRAQRTRTKWTLLVLAAPAALLVTVKLASVILGRAFTVRDMLISAAGVGVVVAGAHVIAVRKIGRASRSDIP